MASCADTTRKETFSEGEMIIMIASKPKKPNKMLAARRALNSIDNAPKRGLLTAKDFIYKYALGNVLDKAGIRKPTQRKELAYSLFGYLESSGMINIQDYPAHLFVQRIADMRMSRGKTADTYIEDISKIVGGEEKARKLAQDYANVVTFLKQEYAEAKRQY